MRGLSYRASYTLRGRRKEALASALLPARPFVGSYNLARSALPGPRRAATNILLPSLPLSCDPQSAMGDPLKVVRVTASDGKSGEPRELAYTNCKVIGNGSFGVVFQARVVSGGNGNLVEGAGASQDQGAAAGASKDSQEDVAIKKVLQDKRFKVSGRRKPRQLRRGPVALHCKTLVSSCDTDAISDFLSLLEP